jgi:hypothetical protein
MKGTRTAITTENSLLEKLKREVDGVTPTKIEALQYTERAHRPFSNCIGSPRCIAPGFRKFTMCSSAVVWAQNTFEFDRQHPSKYKFHNIVSAVQDLGSRAKGTVRRYPENSNRLRCRN